jgi:hypothetical protein
MVETGVGCCDGVVVQCRQHMLPCSDNDARKEKEIFAEDVTKMLKYLQPERHSADERNRHVKPFECEFKQRLVYQIGLDG